MKTRTEPATPYRIETERLVIRCYQLSDAGLLSEAVEFSREHLKPFMSWAVDQDTSLDASLRFMREFRGSFDLDKDFIYGVFTPGEERLIGGAGLHPRLRGRGREIGYWVRADALRQGYATELSAALTRVGFEFLGLDRIQIAVDPTNIASGGIPRKLGYKSEGTRRRDREGYGESWLDTEYWTLHADEYPSTPSIKSKLTAIDAAGRVVFRGA